MAVTQNAPSVGVTVSGAEWSVVHLPLPNVRATVTRAKPGNGKHLVATALTIGFAAGAAAPSAINVSVMLIDGLSGATKYLWGMTLSLPAVAGATNGVVRESMRIPGSSNADMTLEFSVAGGANTIQSVTLEGVTCKDVV